MIVLDGKYFKSVSFIDDPFNPFIKLAILHFLASLLTFSIWIFIFLYPHNLINISIIRIALLMHVITFSIIVMTVTDNERLPRFIELIARITEQLCSAWFIRVVRLCVTDWILKVCIISLFLRYLMFYAIFHGEDRMAFQILRDSLAKLWYFLFSIILPILTLYPIIIINASLSTFNLISFNFLQYLPGSDIPGLHLALLAQYSMFDLSVNLLFDMFLYL